MTNIVGSSPGNGGRESPTVVALPVRRRLRPDVPPFDPGNPAHVAAWECLFDFGRQQLRAQEARA